MKTFTTFFLLLIVQFSFSQNINDNKVSFQYTQLPLIKVEKAYQTYETRVEHGYLESNKDSLANYELRKEAAQKNYEQAYANYKLRKQNDLIRYYQDMDKWEQNVNAGKLTADGKQLPQPIKPMPPVPPSYLDVPEPRLSAPLSEDAVKTAVHISGFKEGLGGSILTIDIQAIRAIRIIEKKHGSGVNTRYKYTCEYQLPVIVTFTTPTDGVLLREVILQNVQTYKMKDQKTQYAHKAYILQQGNKFYADLEQYARNKAIKAAGEYINNQLGYVVKTRKTEIYSVKKFKNYDYSDVTNAYSSTVAALQLVRKDLNHSAAKSKLQNALSQWKEIMLESNDYDKKARINNKISAMIWCNIAEVQFWLNQFDDAQATLNLAENARVLKAKNHAKGARNFYNPMKTRWDVHF